MLSRQQQKWMQWIIGARKTEGEPLFVALRSVTRMAADHLRDEGDSGSEYRLGLRMAGREIIKALPESMLHHGLPLTNSDIGDIYTEDLNWVLRQRKGSGS